MGYLNRYPFQTSKAGRSFTSDISGDSKDTAITAANIALANSLKLRVVAEGVETVEQLDFLRSNNCHEVQGFLFSRPVPADELANLPQKKELLPSRMMLQTRQMSNRHPKLDFIHLNIATKIDCTVADIT